MLIANRNGMAVKGGWKNPYITDGLVAMWDGIWNAGGGVHDPNATVWKDLSGNGYDLTIPQSASINENAIKLTKVAFPSFTPTGLDQTSAHIEVVIDDLSGTDFWANIVGVGWSRLITGSTSAAGSLATISVFMHDGALKRSDYDLLDGNTGNAFITLVNGRTSLSYPCSLLNWGALRHTLYMNNVAKTFLRASGNSTTEPNGTVSIGGSNVTCRYYNARIYSRNLTADEIAANYAVDKARFNLP